MEYFAIIISAIFVNNILLAQFLGICPFLGVSNKISTATGMSGAVCFVITLATLVTWLFCRMSYFFRSLRLNIMPLPLLATVGSLPSHFSIQSSCTIIGLREAAMVRL